MNAALRHVSRLWPFLSISAFGMSRQARTPEGCQSLWDGPSLAPLPGCASQGPADRGVSLLNPRLISSIPPGRRGRGQGDFHSTENVEEPETGFGGKRKATRGILLVLSTWSFF